MRGGFIGRGLLRCLVFRGDGSRGEWLIGGNEGLGVIRSWFFDGSDVVIWMDFFFSRGVLLCFTGVWVLGRLKRFRVHFD